MPWSCWRPGTRRREQWAETAATVAGSSWREVASGTWMRAGAPRQAAPPARRQCGLRPRVCTHGGQRVCTRRSGSRSRSGCKEGV
eukprot:1257466-Rhodomonas_salina.3